MGSLLFEIKDNKDELHRVVVSDIGSILTINDDFMTKQVMGKRSIASTLKKLRTAVIGGSWLLLFSNPFWKFFRPW